VRSSSGFGRVAVVLPLMKTFSKMLVHEVSIKVTKFTRRTREPQDLPRKAFRALGFVIEMCRYNVDVIRCSKQCLDRLAAQQIHEVSVYGERDVIEILCGLASTGSVRITRIYTETDEFPTPAHLPVKHGVPSSERIVIASLVDIEHKRDLLRAHGIAEDRLIPLS